LKKVKIANPYYEKIMDNKEKREGIFKSEIILKEK